MLQLMHSMCKSYSETVVYFIHAPKKQTKQTCFEILNNQLLLILNPLYQLQIRCSTVQCHTGTQFVHKFQGSYQKSVQFYNNKNIINTNVISWKYFLLVKDELTTHLPIACRDSNSDLDCSTPIKCLLKLTRDTLETLTVSNQINNNQS